ncbi:MAG: hypothetical protein KDD22_02985 [Bdellovibrionales bacterium]|nr:hypothetical protein [Bdellovibrionales bacterium]
MIWQNFLSKKTILVLLLLTTFATKAFAQIEVDDEEMERKGREAEVGEPAARKYFKERKKEVPSEHRSSSHTSNYDRYLSLHVGSFFNERSYRWGATAQDGVGRLNAGVTYRVGEWTNSMDLLFRADFETFRLNEGRANKLSLLPMITFPDANSGFPLYFGGGAGVGIFFKQLRDESDLSFDYQLVVGARIMNVTDGFGIMLETGLKNHILLLSDGQFNGVFFAAGGVFQF